MTETVRWAVIGTGRISESFVPDLQLAAAHSVTAVWGRSDERAEAFAGARGIPTWSSDLDDVLRRDDVDAVYIATPPATHVSIALRALDAGKHILVEKPMAMTAEDAAEIFARAEARGVFAMEAMWMKFNPLHRAVHARITDGLIGEPRHVRAGFGMPFPAGGSRWSAELGGSSVLDQGIYPVTLALWMLGPVATVTATGRVRDGIDIAAHITLEHDGGRVAQLGCSIVEFIDPSAAISGTAGWIEIPAMFWATDAAHIHAGSTQALFHTPDLLSHPREGNGYSPMIRAVNAAISAGLMQHPDHDAAATIATARVMDSVRAAIFDGAR
ncbi:MAG: Gfo/Idh/MocA family oxidoreductase [Leifsonia sp.]